MAKNEQLIKHMWPTGETQNSTDLDSYLCFDVPDPKIWGEISECADCQWFSLALQLKPAADLAKCMKTIGIILWLKKLRLYKCSGKNGLFEFCSEHNQF